MSWWQVWCLWRGRTRAGGLIDIFEFWLDIILLLLLFFFSFMDWSLLDGQPASAKELCHVRELILWVTTSTCSSLIKLHWLSFLLLNLLLTLPLIRSSPSLSSLTQSQWKPPFPILWYFVLNFFYHLKENAAFSAQEKAAFFSLVLDY